MIMIVSTQEEEGSVGAIRTNNDKNKKFSSRRAVLLFTHSPIISMRANAAVHHRFRQWIRIDQRYTIVGASSAIPPTAKKVMVGPCHRCDQPAARILRNRLLADDHGYRGDDLPPPPCVKFNDCLDRRGVFGLCLVVAERKIVSYRGYYFVPLVFLFCSSLRPCTNHAWDTPSPPTPLKMY
jgi:hypothetical protein